MDWVRDPFSTSSSVFGAIRGKLRVKKTVAALREYIAEREREMQGEDAGAVDVDHVVAIMSASQGDGYFRAWPYTSRMRRSKRFGNQFAG